MKTYSLDELKALAQPEFAKHKVDTLYATEDGQLFIQKHFADYNANGGRVHTLTGDGADTTETKVEAKPDSIPVLTEKLLGINDKVELDKILEAEKAGPARKGAIAAIELRTFIVDLVLVDENGALEALLEAEKTGPKRKEAIAAIEEKIFKITA